MSDSITRMASALEEQNRIHQCELEQAKRDEASRLELASAERERKAEQEKTNKAQLEYNSLVQQLIAEIRALIAVTQTLLDARLEGHGNVMDKIDAVLELQRIVVGRMIRDTSDKAELDRITAILREVSGSQIRVHTGGVAVDAGRDASLTAGKDVEAGATPRRRKPQRDTGE